MKKKDMTMMVAVVVVAAIFSLVVTNLFLTPRSSKELTAQKIDEIDSTFNQPDKKYFNTESVNPTQLIQIGGEPNKEPF